MKNTFILFFLFLSLGTFAQEKITITADGKTFSFEGIQTYNGEDYELDLKVLYYYEIADQTVIVHHILYNLDGSVYSYRKGSVLISDLNLKSAEISEHLDYWLLYITTQGLKNKVQNTTVSNYDLVAERKETTYGFSIKCDTKTIAKIVLNKIKN